MKALRRSSDVLFVVAVLLLVIALIAAIRLLLEIAVVVLAASVGLVLVKRRLVRSRRQT